MLPLPTERRCQCSYFGNQHELQAYVVRATTETLRQRVIPRVQRPRTHGSVVERIASIVAEMLPFDAERREEYALWSAVVEWERQHAQAVVVDDDYERRENEKSLAWLDGSHRIAPDTVRRLTAEIATWPTPPANLVPTHGDWQPRNWLIHNDVVRIIDFGRAAMRPALTDFARLAAKDFRRDPKLETAFLDGYGTNPREVDAWHRTRVREAIGTAAWAYRVGDEPFEAQGHRMIAEVLSVV